MKTPIWWRHDKPYKIMDCLVGLKDIPSKQVNFILTDPPYGLGGGYVCRSGKGEIFDEEWDGFEDMKKITPLWLGESKRILKDNGTIMVSGTHHNYPIIAYYLKELGFYIINDIIWVKPNPPPTMHQSKLCPSTETIIWARKGDTHYFDYDMAKKLNDGKQGKNVLYYTAQADIGDRLHPTQKPTNLWEHLLLIGTREKDIVLDPFLGSGTTILVAKKHNRIGLGFEIDKEMEINIEKRIMISFEGEKDGFKKLESIDW